MKIRLPFGRIVFRALMGGNQRIKRCKRGAVKPRAKAAQRAEALG